METDDKKYEFFICYMKWTALANFLDVNIDVLYVRRMDIRFM